MRYNNWICDIIKLCHSKKDINITKIGIGRLADQDQKKLRMLSALPKKVEFIPHKRVFKKDTSQLTEQRKLDSIKDKPLGIKELELVLTQLKLNSASTNLTLKNVDYCLKLALNRCDYSFLGNVTIVVPNLRVLTGLTIVSAMLKETWLDAVEFVTT